MPPAGSDLELILCCELQLPQSTRTGDASERRRVQGVTRPSKAPVRVIQSVESFEPDRELMLLVVRHRELLMQRRIEVCIARADKAATLQCSEETSRGVLVSSFIDPGAERSGASLEIRADPGWIRPIEVTER